MKRKLCLLIPFAVCTASTLAQVPPPASPSLPTDPAALLRLAAAANGLGTPGLKPWHAKATWQLLDPAGKPTSQGTVEEWWAGENQFKIEMTSGGFHQVRWSTEKGDFTTGDTAWPALPFTLALETLRGIVPDPQVAHARHIKEGRPRQSPVPLQCITYGPGINPNPEDNSYCFAGNQAAVRLAETPVTQTVFNGIFQFHDRFLARDVHLARADMPAVEIYLEGVDDFQGSPDTWTPPPNAVPAGLWMNLPKGLVSSLRTSGDLPEYPPGAAHRPERVTIVFTKTVGTDGKAHNVEFVGGPLVMQQPMLDAISKWRFRPATLNKIPIEIFSTDEIEMELDHP